jgi:ABC-type polysaccharide/polyol phosphate transport system ATPase subunit
MEGPARRVNAKFEERLWNIVIELQCDFFATEQIVALRARDVGIADFQRRSHEELFEKRADRSLILASHMGEVIKSYCSRALVLHQGRGNLFDDIDLALRVYNDV